LPTNSKIIFQLTNRENTKYFTVPSVTTNANLTGPITSSGNATSVASQTGTGSTFVMNTSPTLTGTPLAPTATAGTNTTQLATTAFVTSAVSTATIPDATTLVKGKVQLAGDLAGTAASPTVATVGGSTAANIATAEALANAATNANTASTIVKRDASGNFTAGTITAALSGNATTATLAANVTTNANLTGPITSSGNATSVASQTGTGSTFVMNTSPTLTGTPLAPTATAGTNTTQLATTEFVTSAVSTATIPDATTLVKGKVQLAGDLSGTAASPTVATVGGSTAANIATAEALANAATNANTASTIVKRDASGDFTAGTITAALSGNASTATLAASVTTNADLTGPITSSGNATSVASQTGTGSTFVMNTSPTLTGTPLAPTATAGTNTTQLATTAFVTSAVSTATISDATTLVKGKVQLAGDLAGTADLPTIATVGGSTAANIATAEALANAATNANTASAIVKRDGSGDFAAGTITADLAGNATTATLAASVTTNADLTGPITSSGNATSVASQTGTGSTFVMDASPTLTGTPLAPTAPIGTNTTQIATTEFVLQNSVSGASLLSGVIPPTTEGNDGDFYVDTGANILYGPKNAGAWGTGIQLGASITNETIQNGVTISSTGTAPTKGTMLIDRIYWSQVGDQVTCKYVMYNTTGGTNGTGDYLYNLPNGVQFGPNVLLTTGSNVDRAGATFRGFGTVHSLVADNNYMSEGFIVPYDVNRFRIWNVYTNSNNGNLYVNSGHWNAGWKISWQIEFTFTRN